MSRRYNGGALAGIFWTLAIANVVSSLFHLGFGYSLGLVVAAYVALSLVALAVYAVGQWFKARKRCVHGIKGGEHAGCQTCTEEEERRKAQVEAYQAEQERKRAIAVAASSLKEGELAKLRLKWLGRSEHYFQMEPRQFENAIAALFRQLGYVVKQTPYTNDRGKDAIAWKDDKKYLIECKRYEITNTIGRRELQIFVAAMKEEAAEAGFYINTGRFANTASEYAARNGIELIDRARFPSLVNAAFPDTESMFTVQVMCLECGSVETLPVTDARASGTCPNSHSIANEITTGLVKGSSFIPEGMCEKCGSDMRLVRGRFWGCTRYPKCRFTRRYRKPSTT
jgi:ssDNA-binding Zn-finger/Zn-ribbon topoisomerase 1